MTQTPPSVIDAPTEATETPAPDQATTAVQDTSSAEEMLDTVVAEDVTRYVVVEINKNMYGISTDTTVELMSSTSTQITRVSHAPSYIQGVINHRGSIIPAIDARSLLGFTSHQQSVQELEDLLQARERDHVKWLEALRACAENGEPFTKATDPSKCAFGKWYKALRANEAELERITKGNSNALTIIEELDAPHRAIHEISRDVIRYGNEGRIEEARELLDRANKDSLGKLRRLFKILIDTIRPLHNSMIVITEFESQKLGLIVDAVHSVFDCSDDQIEVLPESTENSEFLHGLVHQDDGSYILIADIEYLYKRTSPEL